MTYFASLLLFVFLGAASAFSPRPLSSRAQVGLAVSHQAAAPSSSVTKGEREQLLNLFNKQVTRELEASQLYLAASIWFDKLEMVGMASYMLGESNDERGHALEFVEFGHKRDIEITLEDLEAPDASEWETAEDVWMDVLECERSNTQNLLNLADAAQASNDHAVLAFLQPFHMEQVNSEDKLKAILAKVRDEDKTPGLLRQLDTELAKESASHAG
jgi:ferritin